MPPQKAGQHPFLSEHLGAYYPLLPCVLGGLVWVRVFYARGMWQKPTVLSSVTCVQCPFVRGSRWHWGITLFCSPQCTDQLLSCRAEHCPAPAGSLGGGIAETLVTSGGMA